MVSGATDFERWSAHTRELCASGDAAHAWLLEVYERGRELEFLVDTSPEVERFVGLTASRRDYWRDHAQLSTRAAAWLDESQRALRAAQLAGERFALVAELAWLRHSTIPIVAAAGNHDSVAALRRLLDEFVPVSRAMPRGRGAIAVKRYESPESFTRRRGKKLFGTVYRLDRDQAAPRYVEMVETWTLGESGGITLCIPISVGCPNACPMCAFGTYFGGDLSADEILGLVHQNLRRNRDVPVRTDPTALTLYYLGGGDPCLHPGVPELLVKTATRYPGATQIVSTIAVDADGALNRLVDAAASTPGVGFQISLGALDEDVRRDMTDAVRLVPLDECARQLHRFAKTSGRRAHVSLFLVEGVYEDCATIVSQAQRHLDPEHVHIALTVMRPNGTPMAERAPDVSRFDRVLSGLQAAGFSAAIITNDADPDNDVACGRSDAFVLEANQRFLKARAERAPGPPRANATW